MQQNGFRELDGQVVYTINGIEAMPEFFMSLVSSGNHWMFISSNGALTAGRENAEQALFPYETVDKVMASRGQTGTQTLVRLAGQPGSQLWEPFGRWSPYVCPVERSLSKDYLGSLLVFEEKHIPSGLVFGWSWTFSHRFGFVRKAWLKNTGQNHQQLELMDGLLNLMSGGVNRRVQSHLSCLSDAYKDNCLDIASGLAAYSLASVITDKAEPREALQATLVWQAGLDNASISLHRDSIDSWLSGQQAASTPRVTGRKGDFLLHATLELAPGDSRSWYIVADIGCDSGQAEALRQQLAADRGGLVKELESDVRLLQSDLWRLVASVDGQSLSANRMHQWHHAANSLFNCMRGGLPENGMTIRVMDFMAFLQQRNKAAATRFASLAGQTSSAANSAANSMTKDQLCELCNNSNNRDLQRLARDYLPLTFSRRHGDPSRPWNEFAIRVKDNQGNARLDYQGNWRDIFQNWEGLALSHPGYLEGFIGTFLDATTLDGYNPYRVSREGIDWEVIEPDNPWSNIGYWNDHQIIYLQRLLEALHHVKPGRLTEALDERSYAWAAVPYRIASYQDICRNPRSTISFDAVLDSAIRTRTASLGSDGRLCLTADGSVLHGSLIEKLITLVAAKIGNLVPGGGIWMNTQRPEWNDANNALAGYGLSMVTVMYLRRFVSFWLDILEQTSCTSFNVASPLAILVVGQRTVLKSHALPASGEVDPKQRKIFMDAMGETLQAYRQLVYGNCDFSATELVDAEIVRNWLEEVLAYLDMSIRLALRSDGLYEAYTRLEFSPDFSAAQVMGLYPMLEGQVAALSAGFMTPSAGLALLQSLRSSALYCPVRKSYVLYPERVLPDFYSKNIVPAGLLDNVPLAKALLKRGMHHVVSRDIAGRWRFGPAAQNADELNSLLDSLAGQSGTSEDSEMAALIAAERTVLFSAYEATFNHSSFTGRSGAMYAYEGLGSIYWHMVAKLMLCAQELKFAALQSGESSELLSRLDAAYLDIREGIGYQKTPVEWGAFPFDPYSHTPKHAGAQQPGMTGQVKEELLTRLGEFGLSVREACIHILPVACLADEFLTAAAQFRYLTPGGKEQEMEILPGELAFTYCRVPFIRQASQGPIELQVLLSDGRRLEFAASLDAAVSAEIFNHTGRVSLVRIRGGILPAPGL